MSPLDTIRQSGDLLERRIFGDKDFPQSFSLYPIVWSKYVLPRREKNSIKLAEKSWLPFAERHYSTIVRCWTAYCALKEITEVCEGNIDGATADHHLNMHRLLFQFYCSVGAAIDNMHSTFSADPVACEQAFQQIFARKDIQGSLEWLWGRRHQFIHKAVVPIFQNDGLLSIDSNMFNDVDTHWDRRASPLAIKDISGLTDFHWSCFVTEMQGCWSKLLELLKSHNADQGFEINLQPLQTSQLVFSSGSPSCPNGWPNFVLVASSGSP